MSRFKVAAAAAVLTCAATTAAFAQAQVVQRDSVRVKASAEIQPQRLPRHGKMPISARFAGRISTTDTSAPPRLKTMQFAINRNGTLSAQGLPACNADRIKTASTTRALSTCRRSLVGQGRLFVDVYLAGQEPYPTVGRLLVFNGVRHGRQVLLGHIYSGRPFATSFVVPFAMRKIGHGRYGTELTAHLPASFSHWGNVTGIDMKLFRRYSYRGRKRSFVSAGCPTPKGLRAASFTLARTTFGFAGGLSLSVNQTDVCRAKGR